MKIALFTITLIALGIQLAMAQQPSQPRGMPTPAEQPQRGPPAQPSPLPSIREQGEAGAQGEKRPKADEKPQAGFPVIREQEKPRAPERPGPPAPETPPIPLTRPYKASELKGRQIKSMTGEDLGEISDMIIGREGRVEFVLVSYGGFLGMGGKIVAVPYSLLRQGPQQDSFVVSFTKEKMEQAPVFQEGQWPDFYSEAWTREVRSYYGE